MTGWISEGLPAGIPWYHTPFGLHLIMAMALVVPLVRLFRRAGRPVWGAALVFVPVLGPALAATVLVARRWPTLPVRRKAEPRRRRVKVG